MSTQTAQDIATKYQARQWRYVPTADYGGPKVDEQTLPVTSAVVSADRRKVTLTLSGLRAGHVVHVRSPRPFTAENGQSLWSTEAWYTLNALVGGTVVDTDHEAEAAALAGGAAVNTDHGGYSGTGFVDGYWNQGASTTFGVSVPTAGSYRAALRYSNGPDPVAGTKRVSLYVNGVKVRQVPLASTGNWDTWATHTEVVTLTAGVNSVSYRYDTGDDGNVNLDKLSVGANQRIVLFDGGNLNAWEARSGGAATWPVSGGSVESLGGDIRTKQKFGDVRLHVEWYEPTYPPEVTGQARGNSGVFLQERYEVQVLESYGKPPAANEAGAIYNKRAPTTNAATPSGTWQTYDITFRAARFDAAGNKVANARITVVWNGVVVHNDVEIDGGTGDSLPEDATPQSIRLQDHGDPGANPRFRNVWVEPLG